MAATFAATPRPPRSRCPAARVRRCAIRRPLRRPRTAHRVAPLRSAPLLSLCRGGGRRALCCRSPSPSAAAASLRSRLALRGRARAELRPLYTWSTSGARTPFTTTAGTPPLARAVEQAAARQHRARHCTPVLHAPLLASTAHPPAYCPRVRHEPCASPYPSASLRLHPRARIGARRRRPPHWRRPAHSIRQHQTSVKWHRGGIPVRDRCYRGAAAQRALTTATLGTGTCMAFREAFGCYSVRQCRSEWRVKQLV